MKKIKAFLAGLVALVATVAMPLVSRAHEVYVLDGDTVAHDMAMKSPNPLSLIGPEYKLFSVWAGIAIIILGAVFLISISRKLQKKCTPFFIRIKKWAPFIARITLGLSLLASAYHNALFGPEIPLTTIAGSGALILRIVLFVLGIAITLGFLTRVAAFVALLVFVYAIAQKGFYLVNYFNYLGEILINLILGSGLYSIDRMHSPKKETNARLEKYAFPALRVCFGISLIFASWYAKFLHSQLALDTVTQYHLTNYFHFSPMFVVLGALLIETAVGIFFIIGFELRFISIVFMTLMTMSLCFFGESVWPHIILIGVGITFLLHGYDRFSLEYKLIGPNREPVL